MTLDELEESGGGPKKKYCYTPSCSSQNSSTNTTFGGGYDSAPKIIYPRKLLPGARDEAREIDDAVKSAISGMPLWHNYQDVDD